MSRKSRPKSNFLSYVLGQAPKQAFPSGVPNCTTCHAPRQPVDRTDIPENVWNDELASLWEMMVAQDQNPAQIAYCANCNDYGILGSWNEL